MNVWKYVILDRDSDRLLLADSGFETEADAEEQAQMDAAAASIKNYRIVTEQEWLDL